MSTLHGMLGMASPALEPALPLMEWPRDMEHAVPVHVTTCATCREVLPLHCFCPSDLTPRRGHTRAGTPYMQPPARRCRDCRRALRVRTRARLMASRTRRNAGEAVA